METGDYCDIYENMKEWDPRFFVYNSSYWAPLLNKSDDEKKPVDPNYKIVDRLIH